MTKGKQFCNEYGIVGAWGRGAGSTQEYTPDVIQHVNRMKDKAYDDLNRCRKKHLTELNILS